MVITEEKRGRTVRVDLEADPATLNLDEAMLAVRHLCREMSPEQAAAAERGEGFKGDRVKPYANRIAQLVREGNTAACAAEG